MYFITLAIWLVILFLCISAGKIALLDLGNNSITSRGAFHIAEYIKKSKSLLWLNLYMNDVGDEVLEILYSNPCVVLPSRPAEVL